MAQCINLFYAYAISASEEVSDTRFTRKAVVKMIETCFPDLPLTFKETIIRQDVCEFAEGGRKRVRKERG